MTREKIRLKCLRLAAVQGTGAVFTVAMARAYEEYVTGTKAVSAPTKKPRPRRREHAAPTYTGHQP